MSPVRRRDRPRWVCRGLAGACGVAAMLAGGPPAGAQTIGYTASFYAARAHYPDGRLAGTYVFNSLDLTHGPARISASVPFIRQRVTFTETTDGAAGESGSTSTGFGDPVVRLDLRLVDDRRSGVQFGIAASVKPALVGADSGLGTGVADVAGGASLFVTIRGTSLFADALFWKYGDPEGIDFADTLSYSVGIGRRLGRGRWSAMASLAGFSAGIDGGPAPLQLSAALLALIGTGHSVAITASVGLNDASGDFSVGTSWRIAR